MECLTNINPFEVLSGIFHFVHFLFSSFSPTKAWRLCALLGNQLAIFSLQCKSIHHCTNHHGRAWKNGKREELQRDIITDAFNPLWLEEFAVDFCQFVCVVRSRSIHTEVFAQNHHHWMTYCFYGPFCLIFTVLLFDQSLTHTHTHNWRGL